MSAVCTSKYNPIEDRRKRCLDQKRSKVMGVNNMKILIAEDDRDIRLLYSVALRVRNHHIVITHNGEECLTIYRQELKNFISRMGCLGNNEQHVFDMVVLDYKMPGINGIEVAKEIIKINPTQRIIISSAHSREFLFHSKKEIEKPLEFVQKPFDLQTFIDTLENQLSCPGFQKLNQDEVITQALDHPERLNQVNTPTMQPH